MYELGTIPPRGKLEEFYFHYKLKQPVDESVFQFYNRIAPNGEPCYFPILRNLDHLVLAQLESLIQDTTPTEINLLCPIEFLYQNENVR
jgi:hypothetical protein